MGEGGIREGVGVRAVEVLKRRGTAVRIQSRTYVMVSLGMEALRWMTVSSGVVTCHYCCYCIIITIIIVIVIIIIISSSSNSSSSSLS